MTNEIIFRYLPIGYLAGSAKDGTGYVVRREGEDGDRIYPMQTKPVFEALVNCPSPKKFKKVAEEAGFPAEKLIEKMIKDKEIVPFPSRKIWDLQLCLQADYAGRAWRRGTSTYVSTEDNVRFVAYDSTILLGTYDIAGLSIKEAVASAAIGDGAKEKELYWNLTKDLVRVISAGGAYLK